MRLSNAGLKVLKDAEGCVLHPYQDVAGLDTIGYGHLIVGMEKDLDWSGFTLAQAEELLRDDLVLFEEGVERLVLVPLTQGQFDALVLFAFNVGIGALSGSTLLKRVNAGAYNCVPEQLRRWNKAGGRVVQGLVNRREKEVALWVA